MITSLCTIFVQRKKELRGKILQIIVLIREDWTYIIRGTLWEFFQLFNVKSGKTNDYILKVKKISSKTLVKYIAIHSKLGRICNGSQVNGYNQTNFATL